VPKEVYFDLLNLFYYNYSIATSFILHCLASTFLIIAIVLSIILAVQVWRRLPNQQSLPHPGYYLILKYSYIDEMFVYINVVLIVIIIIIVILLLSCDIYFFYGVYCQINVY
jgi:hypothetical protein